MAKYINRLTVILAERHRANLWLAKTLDKDPAVYFKVEYKSLKNNNQ